MEAEPWFVARWAMEELVEEANRELVELGDHRQSERGGVTRGGARALARR